MVLGTSNVRAIAERLSANGIQASGPADHGFKALANKRDVPYQSLLKVFLG